VIRLDETEKMMVTCYKVEYFEKKMKPFSTYYTVGWALGSGKCIRPVIYNNEVDKM